MNAIIQNQNNIPGHSQSQPGIVAYTPQRAKMPGEKQPVSVLVNASYSSSIYITVAGANEKVLPYERNRTALIIENKGVNSIYINFDSEANLQNMEIIGGGTWSPYYAAVNAIFIFSLFGGETVTITKGLS